MNCQICLERYNTANRIPKNLSCGHTFCDRCLKKLASGYEIECPKCRQKSKNNLPISYAIYDYLVLENKADIDESCKIHEYEKLQFFCNKDKCNICALCLTSVHQGHFVSSIKDKIVADENEAVLNKWNTYFTFRKEEYYSKKDKLSQIAKEVELQKQKFTKEINVNYEKLIEGFHKGKNEMMREVDDLYASESQQLKEIKAKIDETLKEMSTYIKQTEQIFISLQFMSDNSILSLNMEELKNQDNEYSQKIDNLINEKTKIKFKTIKWNDDVIFSKKETLLDTLLNEENKLKNHIVLLGDYKDTVMLLYDLGNRKWTKMDATFGINYEFLDYSCISQYKSDLLLVTGGCVYSNYRNTASKNTFLANIVNKEQITFTEFKPLVSERFSHGCCIVRGVPYVFGGHNGLSTLSTIEYFDEKDSSWKVTSTGMMVEREIFAHCVVKDRYIYVFGGFNDTHLDTIEKFDVVHNKWRMLNVKMRKALQNSTAVTINDEQVALVGGYNGIMHKSIDVLNLVTMNWTSLEKMRVARRRSHCYKLDDKIIIIGGEGTEVDVHLPEMLDLNTLSTSFLEPYDLILSKSMNFWSSTMIV